MTMIEAGAATATRDAALARIAVRPPYFALGEIEQVAPGTARAVVPAASPVLPETGAIVAAQAARHMAILGSCAAALVRDDDKQHHYLALEAHYVRGAHAPEVASGEDHVAEAMAHWIDKRTARAIVKLMTQQGSVLNLLDVTFAVMTPRMFGRLNSLDLIDLADPPGDADGIEIETIESTSTGVRLDCGPVSTTACAGHFPDFPAAPVAVVMGKLCHAAGHALARHLGEPANYRIEEGWVKASKLAAAGQHLVLEAEYLHPQGDHHVLEGRAAADGESVGEVRVIMSSPVPGC